MKHIGRSNLIFFFSLAIGIALFAYLLSRVGLEETLASIKNFGIVPFIGFVSISLINFGFFVLRWYIILRKHVPKEQCPSFWKLYQHRMSGYATSYMTPSAQVGGEPLRIALLMKDGISGRKATSSVILDLALEISGFVIFVSLALIIAVAQQLISGSAQIISIVGLSLVALFIGTFFLSTIFNSGFFSRIFEFLRLHNIKRIQKLDAKIKDVETNMHEFLHRAPFTSIVLLCISFVTMAFRAIEVLYLAYFLGVNLEVVEAILSAGLPSLALLIPIPAGLGLLEGGTNAIFSALGISINAVALVLIVRLRDIVFVGLGIPHISFAIRDWTRKVRKKTP